MPASFANAVGMRGPPPLWPPPRGPGGEGDGRGGGAGVQPSRRRSRSRSRGARRRSRSGGRREGGRRERSRSRSPARRARSPLPARGGAEPTPAAVVPVPEPGAGVTSSVAAAPAAPLPSVVGGADGLPQDAAAPVAAVGATAVGAPAAQGRARARSRSPVARRRSPSPFRPRARSPARRVASPRRRSPVRRASRSPGAARARASRSRSRDRGRRRRSRSSVRGGAPALRGSGKGGSAAAEARVPSTRDNSADRAVSTGGHVSASRGSVPVGAPPTASAGGGEPRLAEGSGSAAGGTPQRVEDLAVDVVRSPPRGAGDVSRREADAVRKEPSGGVGAGEESDRKDRCAPAAHVGADLARSESGARHTEHASAGPARARDAPLEGRAVEGDARSARGGAPRTAAPGMGEQTRARVSCREVAADSRGGARTERGGPPRDLGGDDDRDIFAHRSSGKHKIETVDGKRGDSKAAGARGERDGTGLSRPTAGGEPTNRGRPAAETARDHGSRDDVGSGKRSRVEQEAPAAARAAQRLSPAASRRHRSRSAARDRREKHDDGSDGRGGKAGKHHSSGDREDKAVLSSARKESERNSDKRRERASGGIPADARTDREGTRGAGRESVERRAARAEDESTGSAASGGDGESVGSGGSGAHGRHAGHEKTAVRACLVRVAL